MSVPTHISIGELLDKVSILEIKRGKISDQIKLKEVEKELGVLRIVCNEKLTGFEDWISKIKQINEKLWDIEDDIREKERTKSFDEEFIKLARSVYVTNDLRFKIKDEINQFYGSEIKEQKNYKEY